MERARPVRDGGETPPLRSPEGMAREVMAETDHPERLRELREFLVERRRRAVIEALNARAANPGVAMENANRAIEMQSKIEAIDRARADEERLRSVTRPAGD